jgi:hypothetical protein
MPHEIYVEVDNFTVASIFTKDDKSKLAKLMSAAAKQVLTKSKLTVAKKTPKTKNFTLGGALTVKEKGAGASATISMQLNHLEGDKLFGMASGGAETDDLRLIEDLAEQVVAGVVEKRIVPLLKGVAAGK